MAAAKRHQLLTEGTKAPDFRLRRLAGGDATLADLVAAGPVLLAFFKVTCPICQLTFPFLERIHTPGVLPVYGICQNGPEDARDFMREFRITFPMLLDEEDAGFPSSNAYGISTVPTLYLVERDGSIGRVIEGWNRKEIEGLGARAGIQAIRQGENVPEWKAG